MSRRDVMQPQYFDDLYARSHDPWNLATSLYERLKYERTLRAVGRGQASALEVGCSIGVFTHLLAGRCRRLLALDVARRAIAAAEQRCADRHNVTFRRCRIPDAFPPGRFDVIILSEVAYYWTRRELDRVAHWLPGALKSNGRVVVVHWTGPTDYPLTGDQVHARLRLATRRRLHPRLSERRPRYRLDVLTKR